MLDQNFLFMAFLMLCFAGLATMFYFLMRNIDELTRMLKEDRNQMQTNLRALESSLNHLGDLLGRLTAEPDTPRGGIPARPDPLRPAPVPGMSAPIQMADAGLASRPAVVSPLQAAAPEPDEMPAAPRAAAPTQASSPSPLAFAGSGEFNLNMEPRDKVSTPSDLSSASAASVTGSDASALPSLSLDSYRQHKRR